VLNVNLDEIHPKSRMLYDLGASSIYITELVAVLQRMFRIELTYIEVERCETVAELVLLVETRVRVSQDT
jgi:acyl carrier protein